MDAIALHALAFAGRAGAWRPGRVTRRFTGRLPPGHTALKSLTRDPSRFRAIHNHSPVGFREARPLRVMGGDGAVRELLRRSPCGGRCAARPRGRAPTASPRSTTTPARRATASPCAARAAGGRWRRGGPERHTDACWAERAAAAGEDRSVARYGAAMAALMARMLEDPEVRRAREACEAIHGPRARGLAPQASGWRQEAE